MNFNSSLASFLLALLGTTSGWIAWWISRGKNSTREAVLLAENALQKGILIISSATKNR